MVSTRFNALGILEEGLNDCWLAATNLRLFHQVKNRSNIEEIMLLKTCADVDKVIRINLVAMHKHMSLRIVINLVFGAVRILQLQVQFLYDNAQLLVTHSFVGRSQTGQIQRKRKGNRLSVSSKQRKLVNSNDILSQNIWTQMTVLPDLNDDEKMILATPDPNSQIDNFRLQESVTPLSVRMNMLHSDDSDDFGGLSKEDVDQLLSIIPTRKRKHCQESEDDASQRTDIFKMPPSHRATAIIHEKIAHCSFKTPPRFLYANDSENDTLEEKFQENVLVSSTPICTLHDKRSCAEDLEQATSNQYKKYKRGKRGRKLVIDKIIEINNQKFVKQFQYSSTLRHYDAKSDIVPLFEMKKANNKQLTTTPCHRIYSKIMLARFYTDLFARKTKVDLSILNQIRNGPETYSSVRDSSIHAQKKRPLKRKLIQNKETENNDDEINNPSTNKRLSIKQPASSDDDSEPYMVIEKVTLNQPAKEESICLQSKFINTFNTLDDLWLRNTYPVDMSTVCGNKRTHRKDIALIFFSIIELQSKGFVDIVRDSKTLEIIHIMRKKSPC